MKYLWYIAQTLFIGWWVYQAHLDGQNVGLIFVLAVALCAFLTACLTRLWDWLTVRRRPAPAAPAREAEVLPPVPSRRLTPLSRAAETPATRSDR